MALMTWLRYSKKIDRDGSILGSLTTLSGQIYEAIISETSIGKSLVGDDDSGDEHASNVVANMEFSLDFLVSFHSQVMTLYPGDIIITGTPGGVHIKDGDVAECRIDGFESLVNPVRDLKLESRSS
jgi:2-keto-4-pentenoate hydratase/2-oxohepta-3-ene-1,7-dioic acid hydratase in catechol pathway